MIKIRAAVIAALLILPLMAAAQDYEYDLGLKSSDIFFSENIDALVAGQPIRLYAKIHNYGRHDVAAYVIFKAGDLIIGQTQPVSVRADGLSDEVYVDWTVPAGSFNIYAEISGFDPQDEYSPNNQAVSKLIMPLTDSDHDGDPDITDPDDDNDGVPDLDDEFPLDPTRGRIEPPPVVEPPAAPIPVANLDALAGNDLEPPVAVLPAAPDNKIDSQKESAEVLAVADEPTPADLESVKAVAGEVVDDQGFFLNGEFISNAAIKTTKVGWARYDFNFLTNVDGLDVSLLDYRWEYGDGYSSSQNGIHKYRGPGDYEVKLLVNGPAGAQLHDSVRLKIPFWSLGCYWFWLLWLIILIVLGASYLAWTGKKQNQQKKPPADSAQK